MATTLAEVFANDPSTTVSSGGTTAPAGGTQETWTVASSAAFPALASGQHFYVADPANVTELIEVITVSGTTWTVIRGAENTVPVTHTAGFTVQQVVTSGFLNDLSTGALAQIAGVNGAATGAVTVDASANGVFKHTLTGNVTYTFAGAPSSGDTRTIVLYLIQDATGGRTVTWPASVSWVGGTPTLSTGAGSVAVTAFTTIDGGATWYGVVQTAASSGGGGFANPMTTLGDMIDGGASGAAQRLAGNTTTASQFLNSTGTGIAANTPAWKAIASADLPAATASAQGAVILDGTAADIAASPAIQAAGAVGKAADAGHVHPNPVFFAPTGLTGAVAASRYVGATTSGAPVSGTFAIGDFAIDQTGTIWICTAAGTPGTWAQVSGGGTSSSAFLGDGSDGSLTFDGTTTITLWDGDTIVPTANVYTLPRDIFATAITINSGVTVKSNAWRIFCTGTLTNGGTIDWSGNNASGTARGTGAGFNALAKAGDGVAGGTGAGTAGGAPAGHSQLSAGAGAGGNGYTGTATNNGGTGGTATSAAQIFQARPPGVWISGYISAGGQGQYGPGFGGSSGGGDGTNAGGGGGGGGGLIVIFAKAVANNGAITANGGNGGSPPTAVAGGGCGGGGGGGGGLIFIYTLSAVSGTGSTSITGGTGGTHAGTASQATDGATGPSGYYLNVVVA